MTDVENAKVKWFTASWKEGKFGIKMYVDDSELSTGCLIQKQGFLYVLFPISCPTSFLASFLLMSS